MGFVGSDWLRGVGTLRTRAADIGLSRVLPEEFRQLPAELARVDALLDDPVFAGFLDPTLGRP